MADAAGLYVDEADVEAELSYVISATSKPSSTQLDQIIDDIEAEVNGVLHSVGVSVASLDESGTPISWTIIRQTTLWGVCSRTIAAAGGLVMGKGEKEEDYWERYQIKLAAIHDDPDILGSDCPFSTGSSDIKVAAVCDDDDEAHSRIFELDMDI